MTKTTDRKFLVSVLAPNGRWTPVQPVRAANINQAAALAEVRHPGTRVSVASAR